MHDDTIVTHAGRNPYKYDGVVNMPVQHASTILAPDLDTFLGLHKKEISYGRRGTQGHIALAEAISALEQAYGCILLPSGNAAISCLLLAYSRPGAHMLITDSAYAPTREFADNILEGLGVTVEYFDPRIGQGIAEKINDNTTLVWCESPGSLSFEVQDIPKILAAVKARGPAAPIIAIDNTWSGGYYYKP
ncbi:MAG: PLP-dependent transferase, partial [Pseudomonadota bacterium]